MSTSMVSATDLLRCTWESQRKCLNSPCTYLLSIFSSLSHNYFLLKLTRSGLDRSKACLSTSVCSISFMSCEQQRIAFKVSSVSTNLITHPKIKVVSVQPKRQSLELRLFKDQIRVSTSVNILSVFRWLDLSSVHKMWARLFSSQKKSQILTRILFACQQGRLRLMKKATNRDNSLNTRFQFSLKPSLSLFSFVCSIPFKSLPENRVLRFLG